MAALGTLGTPPLVEQDPQVSPRGVHQARQLLPFPEENPTKGAGTRDILAGARSHPFPRPTNHKIQGRKWYVSECVRDPRVQGVTSEKHLHMPSVSTRPHDVPHQPYAYSIYNIRRRYATFNRRPFRKHHENKHGVSES